MTFVLQVHYDVAAAIFLPSVPHAPERAELEKATVKDHK